MDLVMKLRENGGGTDGVNLEDNQTEIRPIFDVAVQVV